ncbi:hypothetical protein HC174_12085 [Salinimicrobium sp. CDJ15-81-2]|jgi:hypothetical protein|uniref:DUF4878 domain-containing protein n=3 Tax=Flavobacteriaceae TaxID=49546 RepID=A0A9X3CWU4_9FLAO|nr:MULTISPECIES: hypothetical protein [Flavobacteriaceae]MCX2838412.1 hypothetical protein [Salinimicrobium profundisediminis]MDT0647111.1 hypothetical protein [Zunongwangia sp. F260]NJW52190.1 hypothetical protein [Salinimicrobium oceani]NJY63485.1 hypothetical protein [Salinimicrobium nanhaiense]
MKNVVIYSIAFLFLACTGKQDLSPSETSKIVVESFYNKDNETLKKYTTPEGYEGLKSVQDLMAAGKSGNSNFEVLEETTDNEIAWVRFTTSYEENPELFKLLKIDGNWKVTQQGAREKGPF